MPEPDFSTEPEPLINELTINSRPLSTSIMLFADIEKLASFGKDDVPDDPFNVPPFK